MVSTLIVVYLIGGLAVTFAAYVANSRPRAKQSPITYSLASATTDFAAPAVVLDSLRAVRPRAETLTIDRQDLIDACARKIV